MIWPWIALGALALAGAYALYKLFEKWLEDRNPPPFSMPSEDEQQKEQQPSEAEIQQNAENIKRILEADDDAADLFSEEFRLDFANKDAGGNMPKLREIAAHIPKEKIEVYNLASKQDWLTFNLKAQKQLTRTMYPSNHIEVEPIVDASELEYVLPEEMLLPMPEFNRRFVSDELLAIKFYDQEIKSKLLYILLDISGSMAAMLITGFPRHVWARGVIVNLLLNAQKEGGKFFFREFDSRPYDLTIVNTVSEMNTLATRLLRSNRDGGDTDILKAVSTACSDIRMKGGDIAKAELLLVSDGESNMNEGQLRGLLGADINLHYVALGLSNSAGRISLKSVAKTYLEFQ